MLGLTAPAWLLGLAAIGVPVVLHLWSRRPAQVVRLGSLTHLSGAPGPRAWGRRLDDLPLLAVRAALIGATVLGLAGLHCPASAGESLPRDVVVADPVLVADSLTFFTDPLVDSLRRHRTPIHLLAAGFPVLGSPGVLAPVAGDPSGHIWGLLVELDATLPAGSTILVLAHPRAARMGGARPSLANEIRWHAPFFPDSTRLIAWTRRGPGDSLAQLVERPSPLSTARRIEFGALGGRNAGGATQRLNNRSVTFDRLYLVAAEADELAGGVLEAAVMAALASSQGWAPERVEFPPEGVAPPLSEQGSSIWLTGQSVPEGILQSLRAGDWLIQVVPGDRPVDPAVPAFAIGDLRLAGGLAAAGAGVDILPGEGAALLIDATGLPLVTGMSVGSGRRYQIHAGLVSAATSNLMLPELIFRLLEGGDPAGAAPVSSRHALPLTEPRGGPPAGQVAGPNTVLLVLGLALLASERLLARRRALAGR